MKELSEFIWVLYRDTQMNPYLIFWKMHIYRRIREKKKDKLYKDKRKNFCRIPESKLIDKSLVVGGKYK